MILANYPDLDGSQPRGLLEALRATARDFQVTHAAIRLLVVERDGSSGRRLHSGRIDLLREHDLPPMRSRSLPARVDRLCDVVEVGTLLERLRASLEQDSGFACSGVNVPATNLRAFWRSHRIPSNTGIAPWPARVFRCELQEGLDQRQGGPLFSSDVDEPYFAHFGELGRTIHAPHRPPGDPHESSLVVVAWDYRCAIEHESLDIEECTVRLKGRVLEGARLAGRFSAPDGAAPFSDAASPTIRLMPPPRAESMEYVVFTGDTLLDRRVHPDYRADALASISRFGRDDEDVARAVHEGEDAQLELKPWVALADSDTKMRELLHTTAAMANGNGGCIIVGVTREGQPDGRQQFTKRAGKPLQRPDSSLMDQVGRYSRQLCDLLRTKITPGPKVRERVAMLLGDPVVVLEVQPGAEPLHQLIPPDGVWIRRNASTRKASSEEILEMASRRPADP